MVNRLILRGQHLSKIAWRFKLLGLGDNGFLTEFSNFFKFQPEKKSLELKNIFFETSSQKGMLGQNKKKFDFSSLIFDSRNILAAPLKTLPSKCNIILKKWWWVKTKITSWQMIIIFTLFLQCICKKILSYKLMSVKRITQVLSSPVLICTQCFLS